MDDLLFSVHRVLGYGISVLVLVAAFVAFGRAKNGQEFRSGLYRGALGLLALHVVIGIVLYATRQAWEAAPLIAYVHPILGIVALGAGQALVGRARRTQMAADAHRLAGRGLVVTLVLVLAAIGVASVA
ncbi:MAG: hypothetical protein WEB09_04700 [Nitriliruptor sp.]